ncbi:hypothetical protein [Mesomycoplasma ovipneumoniae]|uniref:hypothetical protein n=1 Tax=Mesomycoplasma ovipneumoniae TaxID=29562 RepID=UPI00311B1DC1
MSFELILSIVTLEIGPSGIKLNLVTEGVAALAPRPGLVGAVCSSFSVISSSTLCLFLQRYSSFSSNWKITFAAVSW